ncbi:hypothetical protein Y88_0329 [Novosphingobium nitrogenifigens DSM 19370]|uniref:Uncharacterized protein n=1 Tax=Novosphingobium nitrogenifigens DSM 19370 TaxID=983920 RepID=F1ZAU6_9SPHN|nr:hypothetical protein Y88_0329 [Novosphingobium nitrogenifigens DSM 19370]
MIKRAHANHTATNNNHARRRLHACPSGSSIRDRQCYASKACHAAMPLLTIRNTNAEYKPV